MIIVVDIDSTLNNLTEMALNLYNSHTGKNIELTDLVDYNFSACLSEEDAQGIKQLFHKKELWDSLPPIPGSQQGIKTLIEKGHKVVFATATHECNFEWKCQWMKEKFPMISIDDIIRISDKSLLRADIMIDDCLEQLTRSSCDRICLDYPYNRNDEKDFIYDIKRAYDWVDIIKFVEEIDRREEEWKTQ